MKKLVLFGLIALMVVSMMGCSDTNSVFRDPEMVAEAAWDAIYGFGDAELFMALTPIKEGTKVYNMAYSAVTEIIKNSNWPDSRNLTGYTDIKTNDCNKFDEYVEILSSYGIEGITAMKKYVFSNHWDGVDQSDPEEIGFYVVKIGKKWYVTNIAY